MAKKKAETEKPRWEYLRVIGVFSVLWPFQDAMTMRAGVGTIIRSDDPLLDTSALDPELAAKHGIERFATQAFKCAGASEATAVTPHNNPRADAFYRAVGYDGAVYDPGPSRLVPDGPARPTVRTTTDSLTPEDLDIPDRESVGDTAGA